MHQRRKAREAALQVLYALDVLDGESPEAIELYWQVVMGDLDDAEEAGEGHPDAPGGVKKFSARLVTGTWQNRDAIDEIIAGHSENWTLFRMSRVDKAILRMAVYELQYCEDIPPKVTLNEAIDLGKLYGTENSGAFINGILDAIYGEGRRPSPEPTIATA